MLEDGVYGAFRDRVEEGFSDTALTRREGAVGVNSLVSHPITSKEACSVIEG